MLFFSLLNHFDQHCVLTHLNHGFRAGHSCETQLAVTLYDLTKSFDKNTQTDIAILDFSKAFDKVPHDKLLHKLDNYGVRGRTHSWIKSFLCDRLMKVEVDGETSSKVYIKSGVPQSKSWAPSYF